MQYPHARNPIHGQTRRARNRDSKPTRAAPALAVQFFLIPLAVVGVTVRSMSGSARSSPTRTPQEYLTEVRRRCHRRWPAAYELSRLMGDPKVRG